MPNRSVMFSSRRISAATVVRSELATKSSKVLLVQRRLLGGSRRRPWRSVMAREPLSSSPSLPPPYSTASSPAVSTTSSAEVYTPPVECPVPRAANRGSSTSGSPAPTTAASGTSPSWVTYPSTSASATTSAASSLNWVAYPSTSASPAATNAAPGSLNWVTYSTTSESFDKPAAAEAAFKESSPLDIPAFPIAKPVLSLAACKPQGRAEQR